MSIASIQVGASPQVRYLLQLGDLCLIHAQRLSEWCGHGPILEEDIALSNMALDLLGQARGLLTRAGELDGQGHDEDQIAYLREERQYLNPLLVELPRGDFAFTQLRNFAVATWLLLMWAKLETSSDSEVAAIAGKAVKEARYHQQHAADWVVRLGDGTEESATRMKGALVTMWPYFNELFDAEGVEGFGPAWSELKADWRAQFAEVLAEAGLLLPKDSAFVSQGHKGIHSEHMGRILAELQYLQRAYPGGVW